MRDREKQWISLPLRLAASLQDRAKLLATRGGVSLNRFINLAVEEKVQRLQLEAAAGDQPSGKENSPEDSSGGEQKRS